MVVGSMARRLASVFAFQRSRPASQRHESDCQTVRHAKCTAAICIPPRCREKTPRNGEIPRWRDIAVFFTITYNVHYKAQRKPICSVSVHCPEAISVYETIFSTSNSSQITVWVRRVHHFFFYFLLFFDSSGQHESWPVHSVLYAADIAGLQHNVRIY